VAAVAVVGVTGGGVWALGPDEPPAQRRPGSSPVAAASATPAVHAGRPRSLPPGIDPATAIVADGGGHAADHSGPEHAHDEAGSCQRGPGALADAVTLERWRDEAGALVRQGPAVTLEALRSHDVDLQLSVAEALLLDISALCDQDLVAGLIALAGDDARDEDTRLLALELLGESPGSDGAVVGFLRGLAASERSDVARVRWAAVGALGRLARTREDLVAETRAALLEVATRAPEPTLRADALHETRAEGASRAEVERLAACVLDRDPDVREGAARALGGVDVGLHDAVAEVLERAILREDSPQVGAALLASAVRAARGGADALLARMEQARVVVTTPALARQANDYRAMLREGETDPLRILRAREAREETRALEAAALAGY
jgi:hypothetical protein